MTSPDTFSPALPACQLVQPGENCGVLLSSPHSGRHYPADLLNMARLDATALRRSEDAFIDQLIAAGPDVGMALQMATYARAYIDVNRDPGELDPSLFQDPPVLPDTPSQRVQAGLGVVPRVVGIGLDIYPKRIRLAQAQARIDNVHVPYHEALARLVSETQAVCGFAVLLDWHSMPSGAVANARAHNGQRRPQIVLGDLDGRSCAPQVTEAVLQAFERRGYAVAVNDPYAGGYTTQRYGKPMAGVHALQIEIDRSLYMDELRIRPHAGFAGLKDALTAVLQELAATLPALGLGRSPLPYAAE